MNISFTYISIRTTLLAILMMFVTSSLWAQEQLIIERTNSISDTTVRIVHNANDDDGSISLHINAIGPGSQNFNFSNFGGYSPAIFTDGYAAWFHG